MQVSEKDVGELGGKVSSFHSAEMRGRAQFAMFLLESEHNVFDFTEAFLLTEETFTSFPFRSDLVACWAQQLFVM